MPPDQETIRVRLDVRGRVQGVGFRPAVHRYATELKLAGFVGNDTRGAFIEIEGPPATVEEFCNGLELALPSRAEVSDVEHHALDPVGATEFMIDLSREDGEQEADISPDIAVCEDCLQELFDQNDRRYRYPFINCTNCGPRYSIVQGIPYDRANTTMAKFTMCEKCQAEYDDPTDRRFHAQPNACPECGPRVWFADADGNDQEGAPFRAAGDLLKQEGIIAIKGLGGFHLACAAASENAVNELRRRKGREAKPFAVMTSDACNAMDSVEMDADSEALLTSWRAPIVLLRKKQGAFICDAVAPDCDSFGIMVAYTPLHALLLCEGNGELVMTSANPTDEPLCADNDEAVERLKGIADGFLLHDRDIERRVDDSVVSGGGWRTEDGAWNDNGKRSPRLSAGVCRASRRLDSASHIEGAGASRITPVRRSRGYVPEPIHLPKATPKPILAVGGDLKSVVCLVKDDRAVLSEHLGELANPAAFRNFVKAIDCFKGILKVEPAAVVCDLHPSYHSGRHAKSLGLPVIELQHHYAHAVAAMAENKLVGPVLALCADGTGYGTDGTIWGCELLIADPLSFRRVGHLRQFPLVGGDAAARDPWRSAVSLLHESFGEDWRSEQGIPDTDPQAVSLLQKRLLTANTPMTSSLGRLFDGMAAILGLRSHNRFEADAAMTLEAAASEFTGVGRPLDYQLESGDTFTMDFRPAVRDAVARRRDGEDIGSLSMAFHLCLARMSAEAITRLCASENVSQVVLSGGCFLNKLFTAELRRRLADSKIETYSHRFVPPGDGGLALGQAWAAVCRLAD